MGSGVRGAWSTTNAGPGVLFQTSCWLGVSRRGGVNPPKKHRVARPSRSLNLTRPDGPRGEAVRGLTKLSLDCSSIMGYRFATCSYYFCEGAGLPGSASSSVAAEYVSAADESPCECDAGPDHRGPSANEQRARSSTTFPRRAKGELLLEASARYDLSASSTTSNLTPEILKPFPVPRGNSLAGRAVFFRGPVTYKIYRAPTQGRKLPAWRAHGPCGSTPGRGRGGRH